MKPNVYFMTSVRNIQDSPQLSYTGIINLMHIVYYFEKLYAQIFQNFLKFYDGRPWCLNH